MRIFSGFTMFFYTIVFLAIGCTLIAIYVNLIDINELISALEYSYEDINVRVVVGAVGSLLIIYSLVAVQVTAGNLQREKTIAFENPSGRVTISLSASKRSKGVLPISAREPM